MNGTLITPDQGTYRPGQAVRLGISAPGREGRRFRAVVSHLDREIAHLEGTIGQDGSAVLVWAPLPESPRSYGVDLEVLEPDGNPLLESSTAFDVLEHWTRRPRYGFVTDFAVDRSVSEVVGALLPFHVNALQFYDWQYRHDELVAPTTEYDDPLGRRLSLDTVKRMVHLAREHGMASMAYAAVYAASLEFQKGHSDWALFDADDRPLVFEGFLGYMDPTPKGPWALHLLGQCDLALTQLGFDGIHLDQYGEPRRAFNVNRHEVDLPAAFAGMVANLKRRQPAATVTFNAVKNWPMEELAASPEDFYYMELWPDTPLYSDLAEAVTFVRRSMRGKPVVVAAYIPAARPANVLLANAVILASGGARIELGEEARLLADPYFPKHEALDPQLATSLRRYWDVAVRYGDLLFEIDLEQEEVDIEAPEDVWTQVHRTGSWLVVVVVNFRGVTPGRWDQPHAPPRPIEDAWIRIRSRRSLGAAFWVDPDSRSSRAQLINGKESEGGLLVEVGSLQYWALIFFDLERGHA